MIPLAERVRLQKVLTETVSLLCRDSLSFHTAVLRIDALIGVTLDSDEVVLVSFNEQINNVSQDCRLNDCIETSCKREEGTLVDSSIVSDVRSVEVGGRLKRRTPLRSYTAATEKPVQLVSDCYDLNSEDLNGDTLAEEQETYQQNAWNENFVGLSAHESDDTTGGPSLGDNIEHDAAMAAVVKLELDTDNLSTRYYHPSTAAATSNTLASKKRKRVNGTVQNRTLNKCHGFGLPCKASYLPAKKQLLKSKSHCNPVILADRENVNIDGILQDEDVAKCTSCDIIFDNKNLLHRHMRSIHQRKQQSVCSDCGQEFIWRAQLSRHRRFGRCPMKAASQNTCSDVNDQNNSWVTENVEIVDGHNDTSTACDSNVCNTSI